MTLSSRNLGFARVHTSNIHKRRKHAKELAAENDAACSSCGYWFARFGSPGITRGTGCATPTAPHPTARHECSRASAISDHGQDRGQNYSEVPNLELSAVIRRKGSTTEQAEVRGRTAR